MINIWPALKLYDSTCWIVIMGRDFRDLLEATYHFSHIYNEQVLKARLEQQSITCVKHGSAIMQYMLTWSDAAV